MWLEMILLLVALHKLLITLKSYCTTMYMLA